MRTINKPYTQLTFTTILLAIATMAFAQNQVTWKGGTPGTPQEWNCPKNWSNYKVPDAFSDVIIPDISTTSLANPIIQNGMFEVNSIMLLSNATLTVEADAHLVVYNILNGFGKETGLILRGTIQIMDNSNESVSKKSLAVHSRN